MLFRNLLKSRLEGDWARLGELVEMSGYIQQNVLYDVVDTHSGRNSTVEMTVYISQ